MYIEKKSKDNEYSYTTLLVEDLIRNKYGYAARITDIWRLLAVSIGLEKFELLDPKNYMNGPFESYLIDEYIKWNKGEEVNFTDIYDAILKVGDFTGSEKLTLNSCNIEERLLGIFLALSNN